MKTLDAMSIEQLLRSATQRLANLHDSARLDAELLLCHVLDVNRTYLYTWPERCLSLQQAMFFQELLEQRMQGIPIAYLTGKREFWSLELKVSNATLIPRPETELLVETGLSYLPEQSCKLLDLGTGSGAVALAIAQERPDCEVFAVDVSYPALAIAQQNAQQHQLQNVMFINSYWLSAFSTNHKFALIVSNPPYVAVDDQHLEQGDVQYEPRQALVSGQQGLDDIEYIITETRQYLADGAWLWLEHGFEQATAVADLFKRYGYCVIEHRQDFNEHWRLTGAQFS